MSSFVGNPSSSVSSPSNLDQSTAEWIEGDVLVSGSVFTGKVSWPLGSQLSPQSYPEG